MFLWCEPDYQIDPFAFNCRGGFVRLLFTVTAPGRIFIYILGTPFAHCMRKHVSWVDLVIAQSTLIQAVGTLCCCLTFIILDVCNSFLSTGFCLNRGSMPSSTLLSRAWPAIPPPRQQWMSNSRYQAILVCPVVIWTWGVFWLLCSVYESSKHSYTVTFYLILSFVLCSTNSCIVKGLYVVVFIICTYNLMKIKTVKRSLLTCIVAMFVLATADFGITLFLYFRIILSFGKMVVRYKLLDYKFVLFITTKCVSALQQLRRIHTILQ